MSSTRPCATILIVFAVLSQDLQGKPNIIKCSGSWFGAARTQYQFMSMG